MKCQDVQFLIEDHLDGLLSVNQAEALTSHCSQCDECADALELARHLRQVLKNAPVPPPSEGFVDRVLRNAVQSATPGLHHSHHHFHRQGFIKGFGTAVAAGVALWAVISLFPRQQPVLEHQQVAQTPTATVVNQIGAQLPQVQEENVVSISLYQPTDVRLAFHAVRAVEGATITISLSDNLELVGYSNRHTLEWTADLRAGDNVLTLPIKALNPESGKIIAQVTHNHLKKFIELKLDVFQDANDKKPLSEFNIIAAPIA